MNINIAGYPDPLEWRSRWPSDPERIFSFGEMPKERYEKEFLRLKEWWTSLSQKPDMLLIHNNSLASDLADWLSKAEYSRHLTILTGHSHEPEIIRFSSATIINAGTAGAGGILGVGAERAEVAEISFSGNVVDMVDLISLDPIRGSARAERSDPSRLCNLPCVFRPMEAETIRMGP